jgi:hypothetical protein
MKLTKHFLAPRTPPPQPPSFIFVLFCCLRNTGRTSQIRHYMVRHEFTLPDGQFPQTAPGVRGSPLFTSISSDTACVKPRCPCIALYFLCYLHLRIHHVGGLSGKFSGPDLRGPNCTELQRLLIRVKPLSTSLNKPQINK